MRGNFLLGKDKLGPVPNVYADKSSLILEWVLVKGISKQEFTLSEIAKEKDLSLGLVQKVISHLVFQGYLKTEGVRTSKKFLLDRPAALLESWLGHYNVVQKCKMWSYSSAFHGRKQLEEIILNSESSLSVVKALHSSADSLHCKNTNLDTLELYLVEPKQRKLIENVLLLEQKERGYEVLLIEPYYKKMVSESLQKNEEGKKLPHSNPLLTYIDLFHFPLRGLEQAEHLAEKLDTIKKIYENQ